MTYPLGPGIPQVSANETGVEVWNAMLSDPLVIQHAIETVPNNYYLGPTLLTPDTSRNGVVAYDELADTSAGIPGRRPEPPARCDQARG